MVEKALLIGLVALAIVGAAGLIADALTRQAERLECAFEKAQVCIIDGKAG